MMQERDSGVPTGPIRVDTAKLDLAMRAADITQAELSRRTGISAGHLSRVLSGQGGVSADTMGAILAAFGDRLKFNELRVSDVQQAPSEPDGAC